MQEYLYPGQWFDDLGAVMANTTAGFAWDVSTSPMNRSESENLITAFQGMGLPAYPGE